MAKKRPAAASLAARLKRSMVSTCRQTERDLQSLDHDPEFYIHSLRIRMKKLRALLRLIREHVSPQKWDRIRSCIRSLKNAFAADRDQQVLRALLVDFLESEDGLHQEAAIAAAGDAPSGHERSPATMRRLQRAAAGLRRDIAALRPASIADEDVIAAHVRRYAKARKMMRRCQRDPSPERLHRWRRPVKDLYYQALALHALPGMNRRIKSSRKLGRLLGKVHDFWLLEQHFMKGAHDGTLKEIRKRSHKICKRVFREGRDLFDEEPRKLHRHLKCETRRESRKPGTNGSAVPSS